ncbi:MAG: hypothetical protein OEY01_02925 [Desulfobulbaceae bacterium]|nr:hypothetical protein [Desulfobulbaceae bacterium]
MGAVSVYLINERLFIRRRKPPDRALSDIYIFLAALAGSYLPEIWSSRQQYHFSLKLQGENGWNFTLFQGKWSLSN